MSQELIAELSSDELDRVNGGLSDKDKTQILDVMAMVPVLGWASQMGRMIGNGERALKGLPPV